MRIGVDGFLQKTASTEELLKALRTVYQGERVIGEPHALTQVLNEFQQLSKEYTRLRLGLSTGEMEVVRLAAEGHSNKEIGTRLFWSEVTVKRKMHEIFQKLRVADRAHAVATVIRKGLI
jgi:DNA-binding NarL/FixJ family response regulator